MLDIFKCPNCGNNLFFIGIDETDEDITFYYICQNCKTKFKGHSEKKGIQRKALERFEEQQNSNP